MTKKLSSNFKKAVVGINNTGVRIRAYGRFIQIVFGGLQVLLQSMEVHKYITIAIALLGLIGAALPELAVIHEPPKESPLEQAQEKQDP